MVASMAKISRPLPSPTGFRLRTSLRKASISASGGALRRDLAASGLRGGFGPAISLKTPSGDKPNIDGPSIGCAQCRIADGEPRLACRAVDAGGTAFMVAGVP